MTDSLFTIKRTNQFGGPIDSHDHNKRIDEQFKDLLYLHRNNSDVKARLQQFINSTTKQQIALTRIIASLEDRIFQLEENDSNYSLGYKTLADTDRFNGTEFQVDAGDRCVHSNSYSTVTLPYSSSQSKFKFTNSQNEVIVPESFRATFVPNRSAATNSETLEGVKVQSTDIFNAFDGTAGTYWERTVNVPEALPEFEEAVEGFLYVKVPSEISSRVESNVLTFNPFPAFSTDVLDISYTTKAFPTLTDADGYTSLNTSALYFEEPGAVGWVPPGGWGDNNDIINNCGPKMFLFSPRNITGLRIQLRQRNFFTEKQITAFSYGLMNMNLAYNSFASEGKIIFRFDTREGSGLINEVTNIVLNVYNVDPTDVPEVATARAIYETSFNSGSYTTTPVASSQRVWIEVTLKKNSDGTPPALSGIQVNYT